MGECNRRFDAPAVDRVVGSYGAGDSFAGGVVWYLASGLAIEEACTRAAVQGAGVLRGIDPIESQVALT
jgi:ribokinase